MNLLRKIFILFLLPFSSVAMAQGATLTVAINSHPIVCAKRVTLGDIAKVNGEDTGVRKKVRAIHLFNFPARMKTKTMRRDAVLSALKASAVNMDELDFSAPKNIKISRKMMTVRGKTLEEAARRFLEQGLSAAEDGSEILQLHYEGRDLCLPEGKVAFKFLPLNPSRLNGVIFLHGDLLVDGTVGARLNFKARVAITRTMAVASRVIKKGEILTGQDFHMETRELQRVNFLFLSDTEGIIGKRARRLIPKNSLLLDKMLDQPPLVNRKARVKIVLESPFLKISTIGIAKEEGPMGSYIRVMNLDSRKIIVARVIGRNLVKVEF